MREWPHETLGNLCSLITDGKHGDCRNEYNSGYYFISCKDIKDGRINYENARQIVQGDFAETHRRTNLKPGDVLLTNSGTIGRLAIARDDEKTPSTTFQKSVAVLKPLSDKITSPFLYYSLAVEKIRLINSAGGAAQKNLLLGELRRFPIKVPPLSVQKQVIFILSSYDDLIENNRRRIQLLEQSARLLYKEWFVHLRFPGHEHIKITDGIPEGWEKKALGDLCRESRESVLPDVLEPDTPYIGLEHIPRRSITLCEWGTADQVTSSKHLFREDEILFGKIRPYFHKVGIALTDGVASSDAIVIRPSDDVLLPLILLTVSSDGFIALTAQAMKEGSKMPRADWKQMQQYIVPLPTYGLLTTFNAMINPIIKQLKTLGLTNRSLRTARDLILPRLMYGEIAV